MLGVATFLTCGNRSCPRKQILVADSSDENSSGKELRISALGFVLDKSPLRNYKAGPKEARWAAYTT
ncbi:hypothetical protein OIU84_002052, partial [Salix udensis]